MKIFYCLLVLFTITACSNDYADEPNREPQLQTAFNVSKISLSSVYYSSPRPPYIDHLMKISPERMTRNWLRSRFIAADPESNLRLAVFIKEASVTQKPVIRNGRVDTESVVYRANIEIEIKVQKGAYVVGAVFSKAFEERVAENYLSLSEKNKIWDNLIYTAIEKADVELETGIHRYLDAYVQY